MKTIKNILFWILSWTWGLPMTLFGAIGALVLIIAGYKPQKFHQYIYFRVGESWGGLEAGPFFFMDKTAGYSTQAHEAGHGIQNIIFGPFMPFVVSIPSAMRYWIYDGSHFAAAFIFTIILVGLLLSFLILVFLNSALGVILACYFIYLFYFFGTEKIWYDKGHRDYYAIWFEKTASEWGKKSYSKVD